MGCCFSSEDDKDTLVNEPDETTRLINPVTNNSPRSICCCCRRPKKKYLVENPSPQSSPVPPSPDINSFITTNGGGTSINRPENVNHKRGDEQSALEKILQKTARDVIDVTNESNLVEQSEYQERARQYSNRVNMLVAGSGKLRQKPSLPNTAVAPQSVLASKPISLNDINLITTISEKAAKLVKDVKVTHKENLVVPFGVP